MHNTARTNFIRFRNTYFKNFDNPKILEIGAEDTNGSIKDLINIKADYVGADLNNGKNVDVVLKNSCTLPFDSNSFDVVLASSVFEHVDFFWSTYLEVLRVLKKRGLFYLNVPSNGDFHRHPSDSWRFYPDSGNALKKWAIKNNYQPEVLENFISNQEGKDTWNDYVCVTIKDKNYANDFNSRILDNLKEFRNGKTNKSDKILKLSKKSEDQDNWGWFLYYKIRKFIKKISFFSTNLNDI